MKTLFEIQTESGQLWLDIAAQLAAKDAEKATLQARITELEGIAAERDKLADDIAADIADDKLDAEATVLAIAAKVSDAKKPAKDKAIAELQRQIDELKARKDALTKPATGKPDKLGKAGGPS